MAALNPDACEFKPIQVVASPFSRLCNAPKPIPPSLSFLLIIFPLLLLLSLEEELPMYPNIYNNFYIYVTPPWQNPSAKTSFYSDYEDLRRSYQEPLSLPPLITPSLPHQREGEKTEAGGETVGVIPTFRNYSRIGFLYRRRRGQRTGEGHAKTWVRKIASDEVIESGDCAKTTLMIRNIPVKYTFSLRCCFNFWMITVLQENKKLSKDGGVDHLDSVSAYDFVYLPMDFSCGRNKGYAFVNLTNSSGADRLRRFLHGYKWGILSSNKVCEITDARIQGRKALEMHFEGSIFVCQMQSYLPTVFEPYCNGLCSFISRKVGRFLHRRRRN